MMHEQVPSAERRWLPAPQPGVEVCVLHSHQATREVAALIRMREGARLPLHGHPGGEHIYLLEGSARIRRDLIRAGDFHYTWAGAEHDVAALEPSLLLSVLPKGPGGEQEREAG